MPSRPASFDWCRASALPVLLSTFIAVWLAGCGSAGDDSGTPSSTGSGPPPTLEDQGPIFARVETDRGVFRFVLRTDRAPVSCANFVNLVDRDFFDGLDFYRHSRVIRQVGNPYNDDALRYSPGYTITPEFAPDLRFDRGGLVAMSRLGEEPTAMVRPNEFFVTTKPQSERFTFKYPVFGEVVEGMDVVLAIEPDDTVRSISIEGDATPLRAVHAELIEKWNASLDAARDPRGGDR
jgi:peptidyl-prolyl cis-trans isomerase B (cyclophilin B)